MMQPNTTTKHCAPTVEIGGTNILFKRSEQAKHGLIHKDADADAADDDDDDYA
jgi:hypothetical protein